MATFGVIDTAKVDAERPELTTRPHDHSAAVASAMYSVEPSGHRRKRTEFAAPLAALYNAYGLDWAHNGLKPRVDRELGYTNSTNKNNHETGLLNYRPQSDGNITPLIERTGKAKTGQLVFMTPAGIERCKQVSPELGKIAKGFTRSAYDRLVREANRAAKAEAKAAEAIDDVAEAEADTSVEVTLIEAPVDEANTPEVEAHLTAIEAAWPPADQA